MANSNWPLSFTVKAGLVGSALDDVNVFGYETIRSEERVVGEHVRLVEVLRIYAPPETFGEQWVIMLNNGTRWKLDGLAEDNNANPFWAPGLVTYIAERAV